VWGWRLVRAHAALRLDDDAMALVLRPPRNRPSLILNCQEPRGGIWSQMVAGLPLSEWSGWVWGVARRRGNDWLRSADRIHNPRLRALGKSAPEQSLWLSRLPFPSDKECPVSILGRRCLARGRLTWPSLTLIVC